MRSVPTIQVAKIDAVLKQEAEACLLVDQDLALKIDYPKCQKVGHCAIGALLVAAGYSEKYLLSRGAREAQSGSRASQLLRKAYGLLPEHVEGVESINDGARNDPIEGPQIRRYEEVMAFVEFLEMMQSQGVRKSSEAGDRWGEGWITSYQNGTFGQ